MDSLSKRDDLFQNSLVFIQAAIVDLQYARNKQTTNIIA